MITKLRAWLGFELRPVVYCAACGWWHEDGGC